MVSSSLLPQATHSADPSLSHQSHPAGSLGDGGGDASCVVVQSAASREIMVGPNCER